MRFKGKFAVIHRKHSAFWQKLPGNCLPLETKWILEQRKSPANWTGLLVLYIYFSSFGEMICIRPGHRAQGAEKADPSLHSG
jgi:hypothetical protein